MRSSDVLLTLQHEELEVWRVGPDICVKYIDAYVSDGIALVDAFGRGRSFEDACDDYLPKIRGKTLVFEGCRHTKRKDVIVLG